MLELFLNISISSFLFIMHMHESANKSYPIKINRTTPVIKVSFMLK